MSAEPITKVNARRIFGRYGIRYEPTRVSIGVPDGFPKAQFLTGYHYNRTAWVGRLPLALGTAPESPKELKDEAAREAEGIASWPKCALLRSRDRRWLNYITGQPQELFAHFRWNRQGECPQWVLKWAGMDNAQFAADYPAYQRCKR